MIQVWFLTLAYYIYTILVLFLDEYRLELGFMLEARHKMITEKKLRRFLFLSGLLLSLLNLFIPMEPGPRILGDLFSAIICFFIAIYYYRYADEDRKTYLRLSDRTCAIALTVFALAHFIAPQLVLF